MSSSLFPLNMLPAITSIQPCLGLRTSSMVNQRYCRMAELQDCGKDRTAVFTLLLPFLESCNAAMLQFAASCPRLIFPGLRVDSHLVAFVDERRDLDDEAG